MKQGTGCCGCCCTALVTRHAWKATQRQQLCRIRMWMVAAVVSAMGCCSRWQNRSLLVAGLSSTGAPYRRACSHWMRSSKTRGTKVNLPPGRLFSSFDDLMDEVINNRHGIVSNNTASGSSGAVAVATATSATTTPNGPNKQRNGGWRKMSWPREIPEESTSTTGAISTLLQASPVDVVMIRDRLVYIKRDDQLRLPGSHISGNKARKMLSLQSLDVSSFPACICSYGGPQSNAMLALAAVVHYQNTQQVAASIDGSQAPDAAAIPKKRFVYYTKSLPRFLRNQPSGNLFRALALGMELVELNGDDYNRLFGNEWGGTGEEAPPSLEPPVPGDSVWIPQGGASYMAVAGTRRLAHEVYSYWLKQGGGQPLTVCIPGGTCSTALLVHQALQDYIQSDSEKSTSTTPTAPSLDIQVVVVPCVGDESYARRQMMYLQSQIMPDDDDNNNGSTVSSFRKDVIPTILRPFPKQTLVSGSIGSRGLASSSSRDWDYYRFGEPDPSILRTFRELHNEHDLLLDLLYGAPAWTIMLRHWSSTSNPTRSSTFDPEAPLDGRRVMYVHSGGLEGINSQLLRYKYKNLVHKDEIQLPGRGGGPAGDSD